jgi:hypothetical protein
VEEIKLALMQTPGEKAPGEKAPSADGFIGMFYKSCWDIVNTEVMAVIQEMFALSRQCWNLLNSANVALIAKKDGAHRIGEFRPISVMHSMAKLLRKILANRLTPPPQRDRFKEPERVH